MRSGYLAMVEWVEVGELRIAYQRVGEGHPLVLVHGAAADSRMWQPQLAGLADDFTVVAWDEPGAGRSDDVPAGLALAGFADGLAALIESLRLGPAHVAGLSWGRHGGARALQPSPPARRDADHDRHLRRLEGVATRR